MKIALIMMSIVLPLAAGPLPAQPYPSKPIRYSVGFPPGGSTDLIARTAAAKLTELTGHRHRASRVMKSPTGSACSRLPPPRAR